MVARSFDIRHNEANVTQTGAHPEDPVGSFHVVMKAFFVCAKGEKLNGAWAKKAAIRVIFIAGRFLVRQQTVRHCGWNLARKGI